MSVTPGEAAADSQRGVAELQRRLDEASAQQAATAEVLQVINRSRGELAPVFDAVLKQATQLCEAAFGILWETDGEFFRAAALLRVPESFAALVRTPQRPLPENALGRLLRGERLVNSIDMRAEASYRNGDPLRRAVVDLAGARSALQVALVKDGTLRGSLTVYRQEVRPFSSGQITLLQNFAAQAVIAMENARLLDELRQRTGDLQQSLEYQTATSDVLKVISRSTFELGTVLDTLLESAIRLCGADVGELWRLEGEAYTLAAACANSDHAYLERERQHLLRPGGGSLVGRVAQDAVTVHVLDALADPDYAHKDDASVASLRTMLGVPLLRDGRMIGVFALARHRVLAFSPRQVDLVNTFADQAVIAIENARLLGDLRQRTDDLQESLEHQTATSEVLKLISRTDAALDPMLDTLVATAARLCQSEMAFILRREGDQYRGVAAVGYPPEFESHMRNHPIKPGRGSITGRVVLERRAIQIADVDADPEYTHEGASLGGQRTALGVPLLREEELVGVIILARRRVAPFTDKQIAVVATFADQAVIALENARLLGDLRQRTYELAQRQAELRVTFENMGDGVAMFDQVHRLAAWNHNFREILDLPDTFFAVPRSYDEYLRYLAERGEFGAGADPDAEVNRLLASADRHYSFERTRPDGRVLEVRHNPVPGGGVVLIYGDITERKRAEEELRAARDDAEAALRQLKAAQANLVQAEKMASLGQLTAGIAHEIKNPLNFVNNFASLSVGLLGELQAAAAPALATLDADTRAEVDDVVEMLTGNLEKIAEHGRRADGIVKGMLAHSRGGTGQRQSADINALVEESLNLAFHGARAQDQTFNITLERDFDPAIVPIELVPQDVTRVFLNLCGNGFYAANKRRREAGQGEYRPVLRVATRELGHAVEVRIRDNGVGVPPEIRDKLFQPFFTTKPTGEGTGLGLSISYDIVTQQHGGTIEVDSRVGDYTEFVIRLPRSR